MASERSPTPTVGPFEGPLRDDKHKHPHYEYTFEHTADRVLERYRLLLTREVWNDWHDCIRCNGPDCLYITTGREGQIWRVKLHGAPIFVAVRSNLIRTALPNGGWFSEIARAAAEKIGETPLGHKIDGLSAAAMESLRIQREISVEKERFKTERHQITSDAERDLFRILVKAWTKTHGASGFEMLMENAERVFPGNEILAERRKRETINGE